MNEFFRSVNAFFAEAESKVNTERQYKLNFHRQCIGAHRLYELSSPTHTHSVYCAMCMNAMLVIRHIHIWLEHKMISIYCVFRFSLGSFCKLMIPMSISFVRRLYEYFTQFVVSKWKYELISRIKVSTWLHSRDIRCFACNRSFEIDRLDDEQSSCNEPTKQTTTKRQSDAHSAGKSKPTIRV